MLRASLPVQPFRKGEKSRENRFKERELFFLTVLSWKISRLQYSVARSKRALCWSHYATAFSTEVTTLLCVCKGGDARGSMWIANVRVNIYESPDNST